MANVIRFSIIKKISVKISATFSFSCPYLASWTEKRAPEERAPRKMALFTYRSYKGNLLLRPPPKVTIISAIKEIYFCLY